MRSAFSRYSRAVEFRWADTDLDVYAEGEVFPEESGAPRHCEISNIEVARGGKPVTIAQLGGMYLHIEREAIEKLFAATEEL